MARRAARHTRGQRTEDGGQKVADQSAVRLLVTPCVAPSSSTRQGVFDEHCTCDTLSAAPFAGTGALTRIDVVDTGADDSDSAPAYARREPSQSRSEARSVCLARSSCAVALSSQAAQGHPVNTGRGIRGGLLWVTFLGRARKVTSRRAAPGLLEFNKFVQT